MGRGGQGRAGEGRGGQGRAGVAWAAKRLDEVGMRARHSAISWALCL